MSQENVEIVRRGYAAWNQREFDQALELFDPEIEWTFAGGAQLPGTDATYHGHGDVRRFWEEFIEPWAQINIEVEEMRSIGDLAVALVRFRATGRGSGVELDVPFVHLFSFRGSKVIRFQAFADRNAAFEAARLRE
jgi:ketosteroid isomerase-like protein